MGATQHLKTSRGNLAKNAQVAARKSVLRHARELSTDVFTQVLTLGIARWLRRYVTGGLSVAGQVFYRGRVTIRVRIPEL